MYVQSILIPKRFFTLRKAVQWVQNNDYIVKKVDETNDYYRFRQRQPNKKKKYMTKQIGNHIKLIIQY